MHLKTTQGPLALPLRRLCLLPVLYAGVVGEHTLPVARTLRRNTVPFSLIL